MLKKEYNICLILPLLGHKQQVLLVVLKANKVTCMSLSLCGMPSLVFVSTFPNLGLSILRVNGKALLLLAGEGPKIQWRMGPLQWKDPWSGLDKMGHVAFDKAESTISSGLVAGHACATSP